MNKNILKLAVVSVVLFTTSSMQAWRWNMRNDTNKILLMQVELSDSTNPYFYIVLPKSKANNVDQYADFDWTGLNPMRLRCLAKVKYIVVNDALLTRMKNENIIKDTAKPAIVDNGKTLEFVVKLEKEAPEKYRRREASANWSQPGSNAQLCSDWNNLRIEEKNEKIVINGES